MKRFLDPSVQKIYDEAMLRKRRKRILELIIEVRKLSIMLRWTMKRCQECSKEASEQCTTCERSLCEECFLDNVGYCSDCIAKMSTSKQLEAVN